jgi:hypothetical protein
MCLHISPRADIYRCDLLAGIELSRILFPWEIEEIIGLID